MTFQVISQTHTSFLLFPGKFRQSFLYISYYLKTCTQEIPTMPHRANIHICISYHITASQGSHYQQQHGINKLTSCVQLELYLLHFLVYFPPLVFDLHFNRESHILANIHFSYPYLPTYFVTSNIINYFLLSGSFFSCNHKSR